jgi:response regulator RpfG family c-di-GMP phosphodiesterase
MPELLTFADEDITRNDGFINIKKWKVLIIDDDKDIHSITELVLDDFIFQGRKITFLNAYTAAEAKKVLQEHHDIAVILLDVVMETQTAGLDLVKYIREELNNKLVRIILRTGQPGNAPEKSVIIEYDINDYKHKTELTKAKLDTTLITAIRAYRDIIILEKSRKGLRQIIESSNNIFEMKSVRKFIVGIVLKLSSLLKLEDDTLYLEASALAVGRDEDILKIMAGTGKYISFIQKPLNESVAPEVLELILKAYKNKHSYFSENHYVGYFKTGDVKENILLLEGFFELENTDRYLIELFSKNINIALINNYRNLESIDARDEIIYKLGEVTERHKPMNTNHVKRVGEVAFRLAELMGLNHSKSEDIKIAAAMHDVGKILIADDILEKAGSLTDEEIDLMRFHTDSGEIILRQNRYKLLENAAEVASQHHERWDGKGYPGNLKGEEITLAARIAAISFIYDALKHDQPYRKAWEEESILQFIKENSGKIFDPALVSLFFDNYDYINEVNQMYPL